MFEWLQTAKPAGSGASGKNPPSAAFGRMPQAAVPNPAVPNPGALNPAGPTSSVAGGTSLQHGDRFKKMFEEPRQKQKGQTQNGQVQKGPEPEGQEKLPSGLSLDEIRKNPLGEQEEKNLERLLSHPWGKNIFNPFQPQ